MIPATRFLFLAFVLQVLPGLVLAFSDKAEEEVVGSRDGDELNGYDGVVFGMTSSEAKRILSGLREETCTYTKKRYPCLVLTAPWGEVWSISQYIMIDGKVFAAIGQLAMIDGDSLWIDGQYCNALGKKVYQYLVSEYGHPDGYPNLKAMDFDSDFPPNPPPGRIDYRYSAQTAMFTFTRGGRIKYEFIIDRPDNLCQVRSIFRE